MRFFPSPVQMKLLLDQGVPMGAAPMLRERDLDAVHVSELGMARAMDSEILAHARSEKRCIITLDSDFHAELARGRWSSPSVIRIRMEGLRAKECAALIERVLKTCLDRLESGCVVSVEHDRVRVRRLPLAGKTEEPE